MAIVESISASANRAALEAILRIGRINDRHVLRSTVDAIVTLSCDLYDQGDTTVIDTLLEAGSDGGQRHHVLAARSAFCIIASTERVTDEQRVALLSYVSDESMDSYGRCQAVEAIGLSKIILTPELLMRITDLTSDRDDADIRFRAWEVLIRRKLISEEQEAKLFSQLQIVAEGDEPLHFADPTAVHSWQTFLLGLLYRWDEPRFSHAVSEVILSAKLDTIYQLTSVLFFHEDSCGDNVKSALAERINTTNTCWHADTELFKVLARICPSGLLEMCFSDEVRSWRVEARASLVEAVREHGNVSHPYINDAIDALLAMIMDPAYQVRRSVYRAISELDERILPIFCKSWLNDDDLELRKRTAEAVAWLSAEYTDDEIDSWGLSWDCEPAVRRTYGEKLLERRTRSWAEEYLDRVLKCCRNKQQVSNEEISRHCPYAIALTKIGDDEVIHYLRNAARTTTQSNLCNWLERIATETEKHWWEKTSKWPEPWSHEKGYLEVVEGRIRCSDGSEFIGDVSLWRSHRRSAVGLILVGWCNSSEG